MYPPCVLRLRIHNQRRHLSLWLPLFLVFLPVAVFALILLPLVLIAAVALWYRGWGKAVLLAGPAAYGLLCATRGLEIEVSKPSERVLISFR